MNPVSRKIGNYRADKGHKPALTAKKYCKYIRGLKKERTVNISVVLPQKQRSGQLYSIVLSPQINYHFQKQLPMPAHSEDKSEKREKQIFSLSFPTDSAVPCN